jgi:hypothetical protein
LTLYLVSDLDLVSMGMDPAINGMCHGDLEAGSTAQDPGSNDEEMPGKYLWDYYPKRPDFH